MRDVYIYIRIYVYKDNRTEWEVGIHGDTSDTVPDDSCMNEFPVYGCRFVLLLFLSFLAFVSFCTVPSRLHYVDCGFYSQSCVHHCKI